MVGCGTVADSEMGPAGWLLAPPTQPPARLGIRPVRRERWRSAVSPPAPLGASSALRVVRAPPPERGKATPFLPMAVVSGGNPGRGAALSGSGV